MLLVSYLKVLLSCFLLKSFIKEPLCPFWRRCSQDQLEARCLPKPVLINKHGNIDGCEFLPQPKLQLDGLILPKHGDCFSGHSSAPTTNTGVSPNRRQLLTASPRADEERKPAFSHTGTSSIFHVLQSLDLLNIYNNVIIYQTSYQAVSEVPRAWLLCVQSRAPSRPSTPFPLENLLSRGHWVWQTGFSAFLHECLCRFSPGLPGRDWGAGGMWPCGRPMHEEAKALLAGDSHRASLAIPPSLPCWTPQSPDPLPTSLFCLGPPSQALMLPGHGRLCLQLWDKELTGSTRIDQVPAGVGRCLRCRGQCSAANTRLSPQRSPPPLSFFSAGARPPTPPPNTG